MNPTEIFNFVHPIKPLQPDGYFGVGIFAGHYFITAGHVVGRGNFIVKHDGKEYLFHRENAIFLSSFGAQPNSYDKDLAIFDSQNILSPICLANAPIKGDEQLQCYTYFNHSIPSYGSSIFECAKETWIPQVSQVKDLIVCDNFIQGTTDILMGEGNSGSPLLRGNELVGVLTGNNDSNNLHRILFCLYNF